MLLVMQVIKLYNYDKTVTDQNAAKQVFPTEKLEDSDSRFQVQKGTNK